MAERMERPVTIKLMDWAEAQELVLTGETDALIQINATEERELLFEFSEPLLESEYAIFIPADKPAINNILDLRGLTVTNEARGFSIIVLQTLTIKSYETEAHTRNMQEVAQSIDEKLGRPDFELRRLNLLITLHDIGKISIPEELLKKKESLTGAEWRVPIFFIKGNIELFKLIFC